MFPRRCNQPVPGLRLGLGLVTCLWLFAFAPPAASQNRPDEKSPESIEEWRRTVQQEMNTFMEDFRKHTQDKEKVLRERETLQDQVDLFLDDLNQHADDPDSAREKLSAWLEQRRREQVGQDDFGVDRGVFNVKVFFGGWAGFFVLLFILFLAKFAFNITLDSFLRLRDWGLGLFGLRLGTGWGDHSLSPLSTAVRNEDPEPDSDPMTAEKRPRRSPQKNFLFCEVLLQFVNPFLNRDQIEDALALQKGRPNPRPRIGELLLEGEVVTDQEIKDTLDKQKQYRKRSR